jgi:hypothetical protein
MAYLPPPIIYTKDIAKEVWRLNPSVLGGAFRLEQGFGVQTAKQLFCNEDFTCKLPGMNTLHA